MVLVFDINTRLHVMAEFNHFGHGFVGHALCNVQVTPDETYGILQLHTTRIGKARAHRKWCAKCLVIFRA